MSTRDALRASGLGFISALAVTVMGSRRDREPKSQHTK